MKPRQQLRLLLVAITLAACGSAVQEQIYVYENHALVRTEQPRTEIPELANSTQEQLILRLGELDHQPSGTQLSLTVGLTASIVAAEERLDLFVNHDVPKFNSVFHRFLCQAGQATDEEEPRVICEAVEEKPAPIVAESIGWFPFDRLLFRYDLEFIPSVIWKEITVYNDIDTFVFGSDVSLSLEDGRPTLRGSLRRPILYRIALALLIAGCCGYLWLLLRSTSYLRIHIGFLAAFLAIAALLRWGFFHGSLTAANLLDGVLLATFLSALGIVAIRSAHVVQPRYGIFISYRTVDSACEADGIARQLVAAFSRKKVFFANDSIARGDAFPAAIENAIREADVVLVVVGPDWLGNRNAAVREIDDPGDWPRREVEVALEADKRIIPLFVRGATMPTASELPESLKEFGTKSGRPLGVPPAFARDTAELVTEIRAVLLESQNQG